MLANLFYKHRTETMSPFIKLIKLKPSDGSISMLNQALSSYL